jgi:DedD protein
MRLPFLHSKPPAAPERPRAAARAERARAVPVGDAAVAAARTRARRRLAGAVVLLLLGVVGFPWLFETQPRPLPMNTPIEVSGRSGVDAPGPAAQPRPLAVPVLPPDAGTEVAVKDSPAAPAAESLVRAVVPAPLSASVAAPAPAPAPAPARAPVPASAAARVAAQPASALAQAAPRPVLPAATKPAASPPPPPPTVASPAAPVAEGRFVVQVGAYTEPTALREARAKVEKLGLKTYTQVVETESGKRTRVRLGPFATRDEASAAAAKVKQTGLPANILAL